MDIETATGAKGCLIEIAKGALPAMSPDGQRLAFVADMAGLPGHGYALYVANPDGSSRRLIADPGLAGISATTWSPDSHWLAVTSGQATTLLIQPDMCQTAGLDALRGDVTSWIPARWLHEMQKDRR